MELGGFSVLSKWISAVLEQHAHGKGCKVPAHGVKAVLGVEDPATAKSIR